ncbi:MAG TPA: bacteriohemerythrin [Anaeromyxobacteraceae bacterium]|nr:bacteriohemerythrin [Anaeromyxobacteraceae bacterium]
MPISWNPSLAVGIPAIDEQHRELFARVNRLVEAMRASDSTEVMRLMDFLSEYVGEHFAAEEELMQRYAYPRFVLHKAAHDRFVADYTDMRKKFEIRGAMSFVTIQVKTWLCDWLMAHVSGTDMAFAEWLQRAQQSTRARAV